MIKNFVVYIVLLFSVVTMAQESTASPYSYYGLGQLSFKGAFENRIMGGVNVFRDSLRINFLNPASYAHLKRTTFTIGGMQNRTTFNQADGSTDNANRSSLNYVGVGIPLGKSAFVIGVMPYTVVGYKIQNIIEPSVDNDYERIVRFTGSGGVNRAFMGYGFAITPALSLGVEAAYNFGNIATNSIEFIPNVQYGTLELNESRVDGFTANAGLAYNKKLNEKYTISGNVTYTPQSELTFYNTTTISIIQYLSNGSFIIVSPDESEVTKVNQKIKNPSRVSFGLGFGDDNKFGIGAQLTLTDFNEFGNRYPEIVSGTFENGTKIGVGGFYIPKYNSFTNYWNRVTYRAGFNYENTGLVVRDESIMDYGINFGLGLPVPGSLSTFTVGFELGSRGTTNANLIKENYYNLFISLNLNDKWFVRSKYN
jgi:hypothetical protein